MPHAMMIWFALAQSATPDATATKLFEPKDGWAGGDAAYSVRLPDKRTLWIFCDSFAGEIKDGSRAGSAFINNSCGISDELKAMTFFMKKDAAKKATAWLTPADGRGWYWPVSPLVHKNQLFVFLWRMEKTKDGGAFGFKQVGCEMAIFENTKGNPLEWTSKIVPLPLCKFEETQAVTFGSAAVIEGDHAYLFGVKSTKTKITRHEAIMAKVKLDAIATPERWESICDDVATEYSVSFDAPRKRWIMIHSEALLGPHIVMRTATMPTGPWSKPMKIYRCPETEWYKSVFCYAAKAHPQLSGPDELLITYCTNSHDFKTLVNDARIYVPRAIHLSLKK